MESVSTFFKEENDIFYAAGERRGERKGFEKSKKVFVKNLLTQTNHTAEEIAQLDEMAVKFVEVVRESLYQSS